MFEHIWTLNCTSHLVCPWTIYVTFLGLCFTKCETGIVIMEYHSAIKKNKIMPFTVMWMDLRLSY